MLLFAFQSVNKTSFYRVELLSVKVKGTGKGGRGGEGGKKVLGWEGGGRRGASRREE